MAPLDGSRRDFVNILAIGLRVRRLQSWNIQRIGDTLSLAVCGIVD